MTASGHVARENRPFGEPATRGDHGPKDLICALVSPVRTVRAVHARELLDGRVRSKTSKKMLLTLPLPQAKRH